MTEHKKPRRIPEFKSIEEEAHFWDTHDTTDYEHEFTPIKVRFAKTLKHVLAVRFDSETLKTVKGIGNPAITDASTTINETLYGEDGAWKGQRGCFAGLLLVLALLCFA